MSKPLTFADCLQRHTPIIIMETRRLDFRSMTFKPTFEACNPLRGQLLPLTYEEVAEIVKARRMTRNAVYDFQNASSKEKEELSISGWIWDTDKYFQQRFSVKGLKKRLFPKRKELGDNRLAIVSAYRKRLFTSIDNLVK